MNINQILSIVIVTSVINILIMTLILKHEVTPALSDVPEQALDKENENA